MPISVEDALCEELRAYCELEGLPFASADEISPATDAQRVWLADFIERWDAAMVAGVAKAAGAALEQAYPWGYRSGDNAP
jgi:hypothetical protein